MLLRGAFAGMNPAILSSLTRKNGVYPCLMTYRERENDELSELVKNHVYELKRLEIPN